MVEVYGRTDGSQDRLNGFSVRIADSITLDNNPTCSYNNPWPDPQSVLLPCKGRGRYLVIQLETTTTWLMLCEVLAYGPQPGWDWASECNNCPAGTYSAAEGASECTACPANTYGFGAPYTCGDSGTCKNVARSCGSGSDACTASQSSTLAHSISTAASNAVDESHRTM